jgi:ATP-dependent DNA helicase RecG
MDWIRLQKALSVEVDRGFVNLQGNNFQFHEFLSEQLGQPCPSEVKSDRDRWTDLQKRFQAYPDLSTGQRRSLIAQTRQFLKNLEQAEIQQQRVNKPKQPRTISPIVSNGNQTYALKQIGLDHYLHDLPNIPKRRAEQIARLGLLTVKDLLFYYPREHINYAQQVNIVDLVAGETVTLIGRVRRCSCFTARNNQNLTILDVQLEDSTGKIKLSRFFAGRRYASPKWQHYTKSQYSPGTTIAASGLVKAGKYGLTLSNPEIEVLDNTSDKIRSLKIGRLLPVYSLTEGLIADALRSAILEVLPLAQQLTDPLPTEIRKEHHLYPLSEAIAQIHFPDNEQTLSHARRRLIFDEFFFLQLGFLQRRQLQQAQQQASPPLTLNGQLVEQFNEVLPFRLTNAQQRVVGEILQDLGKSNPMNRLVQGDVGSGKTVVAVFSILAAIESGYQAALMAPTEVLAEQHYHKLVSWFNQLYLPVELLTGSTKTKKRREIYNQLATGELPLLVGTHALIQDPVQFDRLGLVVIDEQHRFGVQQRAKLLAKGESPHTLTMTATPIPRSLALTLHGDLDVSQIDELPPGRQPIKTTALTPGQRQQAYDLIRRELAQGRQVYVIFPLIEESEKLDLKAATEEYEKLKEKIFPEWSIGLLHGRMSSQDKEQALTDFRNQNTQIIVSTTVIEVGVDVPNATVMLIENAERFGLSQLHQLRGRVGRGEHQSYCLLLSSTKSPDSRQRLNVMEQSQDGFFIAEMDLRLRGPGEVLGSRQSGLPDFALASLVEDQDVLNLARQVAEQLLNSDRSLDSMPQLKQELQRRYEKMVSAGALN